MLHKEFRCTGDLMLQKGRAWWQEPWPTPAEGAACMNITVRCDSGNGNNGLGLLRAASGRSGQ